jgi:tetratricopeptide (TPR) repeat protein
MEGPKHILIIFILLIAGTPTALASWKTEIYQAYTSSQMERWKVVIDEMENKKVNNESFLSQLVNYQYGYIAWCIGNDNNEQAKEYLDRAEKNLDLLAEVNADASIINAYKSAFYGFKIGMNKIRAPFFGPRSVRHAEQAIEQNEKNPMGYIQYGNSQYYMPSVFGGSKEVAVDYFRKAQSLMEQHPEEIKNDWNYLSLLTLIARSYEEIGRLSQAQEYYHKILKVEPEFQWVKNELYPDFLQKQKQQP